MQKLAMGHAALDNDRTRDVVIRITNRLLWLLGAGWKPIRDTSDFVMWHPRQLYKAADAVANKSTDTETDVNLGFLSKEHGAGCNILVSVGGLLVGASKRAMSGSTAPSCVMALLSNPPWSLLLMCHVSCVMVCFHVSLLLLDPLLQTFSRPPPVLPPVGGTGGRGGRWIGSAGRLRPPVRTGRLRPVGCDQ